MRPVECNNPSHKSFSYTLKNCDSIGRRGLKANQKGTTMAKSKASALGALKRLRGEQERLAAREAELKAEAAGELGRMLVETGAEMLDSGKLRQLVKYTIDLGIDPALASLAAAR